MMQTLNKFIHNIRNIIFGETKPEKKKCFYCNCDYGLAFSFDNNAFLCFKCLKKIADKVLLGNKYD